MAARRYQDETNQYLDEISRRLGKKPTAVLFGSVAAGRAGLGSDVDLLIISDSLPSRPLDRSRFLYEANQTSAPFEPKGYTRAEFLKLIVHRNPIALDSLSEGIVLLDDRAKC